MASLSNDDHVSSPITDKAASRLKPDREMQRVLRTEPLETVYLEDSFETRLARWKHGPFCESIQPMSDHVIMSYMGAMQRLERWSNRTYSTGMGRRGSITFIPAGSSSRWSIHGPMDIVQLYLSPELLDRVDRECPGNRKSLVERTAHPDKVLATLLEATYLSSGDPHDLASIYRQQLANLIAIHLVKSHSGVVETLGVATGGLAPKILNGALDRLSSENGLDVSLGALADAAGLSRFHFCRAFKKSTGMTPHEWLRERRMEQAMTILRAPDRPITEVAGLLGYATLTAFGVAFKRHTGLTPGDWRRAVL